MLLTPFRATEKNVIQHEAIERHDRMIRFFIPKGKPIKELSESKIQRVQEWCNNLPRKILGYGTPEEHFIQQVLELLKEEQEKRAFLMAHL